MAIKFRCNHCQQLMGISSRKAGQFVTCTGCGKETLVPPDEIEDSIEQADNDDSPSIPEKESTHEKEPEQKEELAETFESKNSESNNAAKEIDSPPVPPSSNLWNEVDPEDENAFAIRKAETEFDDMDLTPMVDVTFLLLVFFMITASFSLQKTIQIPAPDPDKEGAAQSETMLDELLDESIQVDINEENMIFIDDEPLADINDLVSSLSDKMIADGKSELIVTAHAVSLHENVIRVIDAAKEVGMQKIRLATTSASDE